MNDHTIAPTKPRACWYRFTIGFVMGKENISEWKTGRFHAWSTDHDEYESGPGPWASAIVEDEKTGAVVVTHASYVHFGSDPNRKP